MRINYLIISLAAATLLGACKTSEANYREAYEKAIAGREADSAVDSTIYGKVRQQKTVRTVDMPDGGTAEIRSQHVRATDGTGITTDKMLQYNVVTGGFKQLFNAKSLRQRLINAGYPSTFIAETAEPYYYVIIGTYPDIDQAKTAVTAFNNSEAASIKTTTPFILEKPKR